MDSEAVQCASEELSDTMYDPFGIVRIVYKRKVHTCSYIQKQHNQPQFSMHAANHCVLCFENTSGGN